MTPGSMASLADILRHLAKRLENGDPSAIAALSALVDQLRKDHK